MKKRIAIAAILLTALSVSRAGATEYSVTDLGTLGGTSSKANGINDAGQIVGAATLSGGDDHAFLDTLSNGVYTMHDLGTFGGTNSAANFVSSNGQVAGYAGTTGDQNINAFLYNGSTVSNINTTASPPVSSTQDSEAFSINASAQVVGYLYSASGIPHAFLYTGGTIKDLGAFSGGASTYSYAYGINSSGVVVGKSYVSGNGNYYAFSYNSAATSPTMVNLGTLPGYINSEANAINDTNQIVGDSTNGTVFHAFIDSGGNLVDLSTLGGNNSFANAINASGVVVGNSQNAGGSYVAFVYADGAMTDLNTLSVTPNWNLQEATGINASGEIVGYGTNPSGQTDAFLLTPVPEPAAISLLLLTAVPIIRRRRPLESSSLSKTAALHR